MSQLERCVVRPTSSHKADYHLSTAFTFRARHSRVVCCPAEQAHSAELAEQAQPFQLTIQSIRPTQALLKPSFVPGSGASTSSISFISLLKLRLDYTDINDPIYIKSTQTNHRDMIASSLEWSSVSTPELRIKFPM